MFCHACVLYRHPVLNVALKTKPSCQPLALTFEGFSSVFCMGESAYRRHSRVRRSISYVYTYPDHCSSKVYKPPPNTSGVNSIGFHKCRFSYSCHALGAASLRLAIAQSTSPSGPSPSALAVCQQISLGSAETEI